MQTAKAAVDPSQVVPLKEKIAYGLGDVAANFYLQMIGAFLIFFYTDVFGIAAGAAGMIAMYSRIFDGVNDLVIGYLADKSKNYKKWVFVGSILSVIFFVIMFMSPDLSQNGKIIFALLSFSMWTIVYTCYAIPLNAMASTITSDPNERVKLNSIRFAIIYIPIIITMVASPKLSAYLSEMYGKSNAYPIMAFIYGTIGFFTTWYMIHNVKERAPLIASEQLSLKDTAVCLFTNPLELIVIICFFCRFISFYLYNASLAYFFKYYLGNGDFLAMFSLYSLPFSAFAMLSTSYMEGKLGKKNLLILGSVINAASLFLRFMFPSQLVTNVALAIIGNIASGWLTVLIFSMIGDAVSYGKNKTGKDVRAVFFSAAIFAQKMGMALSATMLGVVLAKNGFIANQVQSPESLKGILNLYTVYPGILVLGVTVAAFFWNPDKLNARLEKTAPSNQ